MIRRCLKLTVVLVAPLFVGSAIAAAMSDEAPTPAEEMANPSKAEPMMIEPSVQPRIEGYRRDLADCDSHNVEGRQICRDMVNEQYGIERGIESGGAQRPSPCEDLDGAAKTECLSGASAGNGRMQPAATRPAKKETGRRPGFVV
jgi:hypothetical protein